MILRQPDSITRVLNEEGDAVKALADRIGSAERVHIVGIGTSWHGALVGVAMMPVPGILSSSAPILRS